MTAVSKFDDVLLKMATKGIYHAEIFASVIAPTAAGATSGFVNCSAIWNNLGSTLPGTLVGLSRPPLTSVEMLDILQIYLNNVRGQAFGWLYKIGTVDFTATGDRFTHDAATFPVLRTRMGAASQPVPLFPWIFMTAANSATIPVFQLNTAAAGAGYVDQDGNNVVGVKSFTFPNATILAQSGYPLTIEDTDWAVRDISAIQVTTAGTGGTANVYGFEPLVFIAAPVQGALPSVIDLLGEALCTVDMSPAVATSGTAVAQLVGFSFGAIASSTVMNLHYFGHKNT